MGAEAERGGLTVLAHELRVFVGAALMGSVTASLASVWSTFESSRRSG